MNPKPCPHTRWKIVGYIGDPGSTQTIIERCVDCLARRTMVINRPKTYRQRRTTLAVELAAKRRRLHARGLRERRM